MPHASLSQSSYIALSVRSLVAKCLDQPSSAQRQKTIQQQLRQPEDWKVQIAVHGCAGLDLVPVSSMTGNAPLLSISDQSYKQLQKKVNDWNPLVSNTTHCCRWDSMICIPLRWRDLPRDAYLKFHVIGPNDAFVRFFVWMLVSVFVILLHFSFPSAAVF
jgi:hypothetical protein